jgi:two-component system response regulator GlrR
MVIHSGVTVSPEAPRGTKAHRSSRADVGPHVVRGFRLTVVEGPRKGLTFDSAAAKCSIGSHASNDLVVDDETVSRFHCEVTIDAANAACARIRDLGSLNFTHLDGVHVTDGFLRADSSIRLGASVLRFQLRQDHNALPLSRASRFGALIGTSHAMRGAFALLERAAASSATVLLEGETGTGKGKAAESIHAVSARRGGPFVTLDCSALPANLLESELFGHERGSFTGAAGTRIGAFEEASGGTVFLDEIGEMPLDLQPKLLRVLESREIRRVGSNQQRPVDVRVIVATNRDLRAEVNAGRFRSDLYFRVAVLKIGLPALRDRPEDLPVLVDAILDSLGADAHEAARLRTPELLAQLQGGSWPGNVRELRNCVERCLVFQDTCALSDESPTGARSSAPRVDTAIPIIAARQCAVDAFEKAYLVELLRVHDGRMLRAAAAAGIGRVYLYKLLRRHGLK